METNLTFNIFQASFCNYYVSLKKKANKTRLLFFKYNLELFSKIFSVDLKLS